MRDKARRAGAKTREDDMLTVANNVIQEDTSVSGAKYAGRLSTNPPREEVAELS